jgi:hypothetical protein
MFLMRLCDSSGLVVKAQLLLLSSKSRTKATIKARRTSNLFACNLHAYGHQFG